jgi:hypothetical protein
MKYLILDVGDVEAVHECPVPWLMPVIVATWESSRD